MLPGKPPEITAYTSDPEEYREKGRIMKFTFGQYEGRYISDVPTPYLKWLVEEEVDRLMDDDCTLACDAATEELMLRGIEV